MRMWDAEILFLGSFHSFFSYLSDCARVCMSVFRLVEVAATIGGLHRPLASKTGNSS